MNASRTAARLLRCYPAPWRLRYGDELRALIVDMSDGGPVPWRTRADVIRAGGRERLRGLGLSGDGNPDVRVRGGASLVLWAWTLFAFAGAIVQKTSEHWQQAIPSRGHAGPSAAFAALTVVAVAAAVLVLAGIAVALPSLIRLVRDDGWPRIRRQVRIAGAATLILLGATIGVVIWAHGLTGHQRDGADTAYAAVIAVWALLGLGTLLAWTAAAVQAERCLDLPTRTLKAQAGLAIAVAVAMGAMAAATAVWWIAVAVRAPSALTGSHSVTASAAVPQLIVAMVLMLLSAGAGAVGARQAIRALPALAAE